MLKPGNAIRLLGGNGDKLYALTGSRLSKALAVTTDDSPRFWIATHRLAIIKQDNRLAIGWDLYGAVAQCGE